MEFIIVSGLSGAGKSKTMSFMEDTGYYCIDNMPAELVSVFVELIEKSDKYNKVTIVTDTHVATL